MKLNWDNWLYGLGSAIVGGGSSAVVGGIVSAFAFKVDVTTWAGAFKIMSVMLANFVVAGFFAMFFFLKQSPLPPPIIPASDRETAPAVIKALIIMALLMFGTGCASQISIHGIPNFAEVATGIYRGGEPNAEGWIYLRSLGVSNTVMLDVVGEAQPLPESDTNACNALNSMWCFYRPIPLSQQLGIVPLNSNNITEAVSDLDFLPGTFVHCAHGQDRTGLIVALYRVGHGWSKAEAEKEMLAHGFHKELHGLWSFWKDFGQGSVAEENQK